MDQDQNYKIFPADAKIPMVLGGLTRFSPSEQDVSNGLKLLSNHLKGNIAIRDLAEYNIRFFGFINQTKEKILLAEYICRSSSVDWRNNLEGAEGGGNCYFEIKVNLDKAVIYDLKINGII